MGLLIGVVERGKRYTFTFGRIARGSDARPTIRTEFEIGSVTKTFTGMLLAHFVRERLVHYDDPLQKFMPQGIRVPSFRGRRITLLDLATHTSGLPRSLDLHRPWRPGPKEGTGVGLAWQTFPTPGFRPKPVTKNGGTLGFHCWVGFVPQTRTGVVLMVNQGRMGVFDRAGLDILRFLNRE
jgi:CubicO group peptidase (beta-lactamase class C family)